MHRVQNSLREVVLRTRKPPQLAWFPSCRCSTVSLVFVPSPDRGKCMPVKKVRDRVMLEKGKKIHALGCEYIEIKRMGAGRNERMKPRGQ
jgi:hypothetical protein